MQTPFRIHRSIASLMLLDMISLLIAACGSPATTSAPATTAPAQTEPTAASNTGGTEATKAPEPATAAPSTGGTDTQGVMTVSVEQQPTWVRNFNPLGGSSRFPTINGIYEPLMVYNTIKGELVPWLATDYKWSDGDKKLTLTIREGVKWSDGQPFSAKDVAFTFNLFKNTKGLQGSGGQAMNGDTAYVDSVKATDDKTVEFTFKQVFAPGLYDILNQNIVPEHIWKDVADPAKFANENPVGTGPFTEVSVFQNQVYQVNKNPNYWQAGKPNDQWYAFPSLSGQ